MLGVATVFPLAKATSIYRSILTTCSGVVFFPRAMISSFSVLVSLIRTGTEQAG